MQQQCPRFKATSNAEANGDIAGLRQPAFQTRNHMQQQCPRFKATSNAEANGDIAGLRQPAFQTRNHMQQQCPRLRCSFADVILFSGPISCPLT